MRLVVRFPESSLSIRTGLAQTPGNFYPLPPGGFLAEVYRGFQRFSEILKGYQRFSEIFRGSKARRKKTSGRFRCEPSFGGMSWPTLLAFLAQRGDVVGGFSTRFLGKGFASGVPQIPSCNASKVCCSLIDVKDVELWSCWMFLLKVDLM